HIYYNDANTNHWITINTIGVESNRNGIGARIEATSALGTQIREVRSGEGFRLMSTLNTHFGFGEDTVITSIVIKWPSGTVDTLEDVAVDQVISVEEGSTILGLEDHLVDTLILYPNPTDSVLNLSSLSGFDTPQFAVFDLQGRKVINNSKASKSIDVSTLSQGTYILKLFDASKTQTQKFVKR
ncbi:MAG: ASPIC/UnbV domain-containing protein, partial [Flavobacteriaceae bacterium]